MKEVIFKFCLTNRVFIHIYINKLMKHHLFTMFYFFLLIVYFKKNNIKMTVFYMILNNLPAFPKVLILLCNVYQILIQLNKCS